MTTVPPGTGVTVDVGETDGLHVFVGMGVPVNVAVEVAVGLQVIVALGVME
jgi:hypothetical protein